MKERYQQTCYRMCESDWIPTSASFLLWLTTYSKLLPLVVFDEEDEDGNDVNQWSHRINSARSYVFSRDNRVECRSAQGVDCGGR